MIRQQERMRLSFKRLRRSSIQPEIAVPLAANILADNRPLMIPTSERFPMRLPMCTCTYKLRTNDFDRREATDINLKNTVIPLDSKDSNGTIRTSVQIAA